MSKFNFIDLFAGIGGIRIPYEKHLLAGVFRVEHVCLVPNGISTPSRLTLTILEKCPLATSPRLAKPIFRTTIFYWRVFRANLSVLLEISRALKIHAGTLFFDIARILKQKQPSAFLLENVKQLLTHDKGQTFAVIKEQLSRLGLYHLS